MLGAKLRCAAGQEGGGSIDDYLAYYTGDNVSGTTVFDETGNHNGAITGNVTTGPGYVGDALFFTPPSRFTASIPVGNGDATFALIIKPTAAPTSSQVFVDQYGSPTISEFRGIMLDTVGVKSVTRNSSGTFHSTASIDIYDGQPHIVHFVQEGSIARLYVDGVEEGSVDATTTGGYANTFSFGSRQSNAGPDLYYNGYEDEIRIFDYAWTLDQVETDASNYGF